MADGAGLDYMSIVRMSMIPELIKAACSIVVAWGEATAGGAAAGKPVHLRALDWDTGGPFQKYPLLLTMHPGAGNGSTFTSLTWAGLLGSITGMSSSGMGVGEKVWLQYEGTENIFGYVWHFLLQDILQFDMDTDEALSRIATANRTCSIWCVSQPSLAQHSQTSRTPQLYTTFKRRARHQADKSANSFLV